MSEKEDSLSFKLGPAKSFIFLGGGALLLRLIQWAKGSGIKCAVITSPRHGEEIFEGKQFKELLRRKFPFLITDRISTKEVEKFIHQFDEPAFFLLEPLGFLKKISFPSF